MLSGMTVAEYRRVSSVTQKFKRIEKKRLTVKFLQSEKLPDLGCNCRANDAKGSIDSFPKKAASPSKGVTSTGEFPQANIGADLRNGHSDSHLLCISILHTFFLVCVFLGIYQLVATAIHFRIVLFTGDSGFSSTLSVGSGHNRTGSTKLDWVEADQWE